MKGCGKAWQDGEALAFDDEAEWLSRAASRIATAGSASQASPLRVYLRKNYDALIRIKAERKLSWPQVAVILSERGLAKADGSKLDGNAVAVMAAHVRLERDPKPPKRRARARVRRGDAAEPPAPTPAPPAPRPLPVTAEEANPPASPVPVTGSVPATESPFSTGDPALDRALNGVRTLTPPPPSGGLGARGRRNTDASKEQDDGGENG